MVHTQLQIGPHTKTAYRAGEFVASQKDTYPILLEVIRVEDDGLLRVRGLDWAAGYSAVLASEQVRYVSSILSSN